MSKSKRDLSGSKVLVTGGAGFIGSHTVDRLIETGCGEIIVIDDMVRGRPENLWSAQARGPVRLMQADMRDCSLLREVLPGTDTVFHLAALRITQCAAEPRRAVEVMVNATFDLLELCVEHKVSKVVMASSASVYGEATEFPTLETHHPYGNRTLYGAAKSFGEGLLRSFNDMYGLDYVALRYFNAYGPRMDIHGRYTEVLIRWMERMETGLPPIIFGDGLQTMDFVHVSDIATANICAATSAATDVVLNVGNGVETSLLELAQALGRAMGRPTLTPVHEAARAVNPVARRLASTVLAKELIGFTPSLSLEEGLRDLVEWWRGQKQEVAFASVDGRAA